ncbi:MAG: exopolyphosphatase [Deltaproteobacteria bacterium]|nr:exopolyphosphatase [Deltaproteobacteria bacterium]
MRYASIDIGTNTLRLLIADRGENGKLKPVAHKRVITRLGGNFSEERGIDLVAAQRSFAALDDFKKTIVEKNADGILAVATSVVRRSRNGAWFVSEVYKRSGIEIRVIDGQEEARLSLLGVLSVLNVSAKKILVFDIGGGSTEFIAVDGNERIGDTPLVAAWSMEMGVVHLTEKYLTADPPSGDDIKGLETEIEGVLTGLKSQMENSGVSGYSAGGGAALVATAGTITTLAALDMDMQVYDRDRINNYVLTKKKIAVLYKKLLGMSLAERSSVLSLEKGREDLIIPGSAITLLVMDMFGFDLVVVSDAGLLEGNIIDRLKIKGVIG